MAAKRPLRSHHKDHSSWMPELHRVNENSVKSSGMVHEKWLYNAGNGMVLQTKVPRL